ncbi:hypothetical protein Sste5346_008286 [Sporothrix stenoceras]|uniref:Uncharacterized protein n=1 Tax=Sporothrix stenoceras TaxID=5173 RepID=A0ABR3YRA3_9PEZI
MASTVKTYHLAPTFDFAPDGPLALGSVLSTVKRPVPPLTIGNVGSTMTTTDDASTTPKIFSTTKTNYTLTTSTKRTTSAALSLDFLSSIFGVGPGGSNSHNRDSAVLFSFARLDTQEWYPSTEELESLIRQPTVSQYLKVLRSWVPKQVFVVTGIKIAYGAYAQSKKARHVDTGFEVKLDPGTAAGVSDIVTLGPKFTHSVKKGKYVEWSTGVDGEEDIGFVFAYKVQRVTVKLAKKEGKYGVTDHDEYTSGSMLGVDDHVASEAEQFEIDTVDTDEVDEGAVLLEAGDGTEILWLVVP